MQPLSDPLVTITLPDGNVEKFKARFEPECQPFTAQVYGQMAFEPVGNTHSTLEQLSLRPAAHGRAGRSQQPHQCRLTERADQPSLYCLNTREGLIDTIDQS